MQQQAAPVAPGKKKRMRSVKPAASGGKKQRRYPTADSLVLHGGSGKAILTVDLDPSGSRLATGSVDNSTLLFNFGAMGTGRRPYREFDPDPGHVVNCVRWPVRIGSRSTLAG